MSKAASTEFSLRREIEAAKALVNALDSEGDKELVTDTIEGETGLFEALEAALCQIDECEIVSTGLGAKIAQFSERKRLADNRAARLKALIEQALLTSEQMSIRLPAATLTISKRAPGVIIEDESLIPSEFFVEQERPAPKLNKKALAEALKTQPKIPGACLDNGSVSLSIRRK